MQLLIYPIFTLFLLLHSFFTTQDFEAISDQFMSPEYMYLDEVSNNIYIGLATYPGVAVFDVNSQKLEQIISTPSPVQGVLVENGKLFAAAGKDSACIYVYDLHSERFHKSIKTGHGPTDITISKKSQQLFISNRFSNDVSVIDLNKQKEVKRIAVGREPVAISLSPDEHLIAVANLLPMQASTDKYISSNITLIERSGWSVIKQIELPNGSYNLKDIVYSNDGKFMYVTHLIGRYNVLTNQIEKGWINTNALSIIDTKSREYYTSVLLDDIHKGAANPNGLEISDDGRNLLVAISGTNELFIIDRAGMHDKIEEARKYQTMSQSIKAVSNNDEKIKRFETPDEYQRMGIRFEDISKELGFLAPVRKRIQLNGIGPAYVISHSDKLYISNYFSDELELISLSGERRSTSIKIGVRDMLSSQERYGEHLFHSASRCFQQWQSCASCHPGEGRVDGLNWDLMNDGIGNPKNTKSLLYTHVTPPAMATGIRANAETGVRAGFKFIQFFNVSEEDAQAVDAYLKSLKPVASPYLVNGKLSKSAKQGKQVFDKMGCANCHSGTYFTDLQQHDMGERGEYDKQNIWDTPTLIELWRTGPYMHDGQYNNLQDVFKLGIHGLCDDMNEIDIEELTEYLLSL